MTDGDSFKTGGGLVELGAAIQEVSLEGQRLGNYRIESLIAKGGMGRVYRGTRSDGQFDRAVAIKVLPTGLGSEYTQRFEQERQILASLSHPGIAQLYDAGLSDSGSLYLVMELIDGMPIDEYVRRQNFGYREKAALLLTLTRTLAFAHSRLVVHRDLKPSNVFVSRSGELKLLDFGIAKILEVPDDMTVENRPMTPKYASPEQILNEPISVASDIYQIGLLFLSLFRQRSDMPEETQASATERAARKTSLTTRSRLAESLPPELDAIINQCLRAEPHERYASATELAADLDNYLAGYPVTARNPGALQRTSKFVQRNAAAVASALTVLVLIIGTVTVYTRLLAEQRDIAEAAAEDARIEAVRAEQVADFLTDLFRATEPNAPVDQLPTTADLLELGARRALDPASAPPEVRLRMLNTLGHVHLEKSRYDQARPLLDAAVEQARQLEPAKPGAVADALVRRAYLDWRGGTVEDAEPRLEEAESLVAGIDEHLDTWAKAVMDRAWVASMLRDNERAAEILQPLVDVARSRTDMDPGGTYRALERLSSIHQKLGNLELASRLRQESEPYLLQKHGTKGRSYAVFVANSSNLEHSLGRFEKGRSLNRKALELYDTVYGEQPVSYRAVARRNLARKLLTAGRFDEGMQELATSTAELARVKDLPTDEDASHHFYHGELSLMMRRWPEAIDYLNRAKTLILASAEPSESWLRSINAMTIWSSCMQGESQLMGAPPDALAQVMSIALNMGGETEAEIRAARACVHWRQGSSADALQEIDVALSLMTSPGSLLSRADFLALRAGIRKRLGDDEEARSDIAAAIESFSQHGLDDHPSALAFRQIEREIKKPGG